MPPVDTSSFEHISCSHRTLTHSQIQYIPSPRIFHHGQSRADSSGSTRPIIENNLWPNILTIINDLNVSNLDPLKPSAANALHCSHVCRRWLSTQRLPWCHRCRTLCLARAIRPSNDMDKASTIILNTNKPTRGAHSSHSRARARS